MRRDGRLLLMAAAVLVVLVLVAAAAAPVPELVDCANTLQAGC
jgi:hypothetical protein